MSLETAPIAARITHRPHHLSAFALTAFGAALLAACGGGGGNGPAAATSSDTTASSASTPTQTVQYVFGKSASDGRYPYASLVQAGDGQLYGTTFAGGSHNAGTVFRATPGGEPETLYTFGSTDSDGAAPIGGLVPGIDGTLYGTTSDRGLSGKGTLFRLTPSGTLSTLHSFGADGDGATPSGALALGSDGNLYGTTRAGGAFGGGTVYRVTPAGVLTVLYSFGGVAGDGAGPHAGLVQAADGNLYGTTPLGGINNEGTVFKVIPGGAVSVVHAFSAIVGDQNADGALPYAGLVVGKDGALYGTTSYGGSSNYGTAYKVTTGGAFTALHQFAGGADGAYPRAALALDSDGSLLGTTAGAGAGNGGVLFRLATSGEITKLHDFAATPTTGSAPYAALVRASDGGFYGTTLGNGLGGGTLFRWK